MIIALTFRCPGNSLLIRASPHRAKIFLKNPSFSSSFTTLSSKNCSGLYFFASGRVWARSSRTSFKNRAAPGPNSSVDAAPVVSLPRVLPILTDDSFEVPQRWPDPSRINLKRVAPPTESDRTSAGDADETGPLCDRYGDQSLNVGPPCAMNRRHMQEPNFGRWMNHRRP